MQDNEKKPATGQARSLRRAACAVGVLSLVGMAPLARA
jgi:hypothetical protein